MKSCDKNANMKQCNCTYEPCPRKGICCECITYHRTKNQLPACYFPDDVERSYDRSVRNFLEIYNDRRGR